MPSSFASSSSLDLKPDGTKIESVSIPLAFCCMYLGDFASFFMVLFSFLLCFNSLVLSFSANNLFLHFRWIGLPVRFRWGRSF